MLKLRSIEIQGFRAFGPDPEQLEFGSALAVIWGPNSQGKTSVAEAIEFLLTGRTVRPELLGGARMEFSACLRNVHLDGGVETVVRAAIEDATGVVHDVERRLIADYGPQEDCRSVLTIDSQQADDLSALGIHLADPPLSAPVLMQHTLRFAISARPQERADYFKGVMEVRDLEVVRSEIAALLDRVAQPPAPAVDQLRRCQRIDGVGEILRGAEAASPLRQTVEDAISEALKTILGRAGIEPSAVPKRFTELVAAVESVVRERREAAFPLTALQVRGGADPVLSTPGFERLRSFAKTLGAVERETARLVRVFEAVLAIPDMAASQSAVDCPVCETRDALTPERIAAMREYIERSTAYATQRQEGLEELGAARRASREAGERVRSQLPQPEWTQEEGDRYQRVAGELLGDAGARTFVELSESLRELRTIAGETLAHSASFEQAVDGAEQAVRESSRPDFSLLEKATVELQRSLTAFRDARDAYAEKVSGFSGSLRSEIDQRANVREWVDLIDLSSKVDELAGALAERKARQLVREEIEAAIAAIDSAKAAIFDSKVVEMSDEIARWWGLMRREQLVTFGGVRRRGTGRRYVDLKAVLRNTSSAGTEIERDAAGIFSDSQLNCLGLAIFLARCTKGAASVVVLDDPVLGSDEEHRTTFARFVIEALLAQGTQVLVTTYDVVLQRDLGDYYQHVPPDVFTVTTDDPKQGASVVKSSDTLESLLANARPYLRSQVPEVRKTGASRLRDAAERLCKEIIVKKHRENSEECAITDYEGKTLGNLIPKVEPFLTDTSHPGKLRAIGRILSPGSHDAPPPTTEALGVAEGDLKAFKREYL